MPAGPRRAGPGADREQLTAAAMAAVVSAMSAVRGTEAGPPCLNVEVILIRLSYRSILHFWLLQFRRKVSILKRISRGHSAPGAGHAPGRAGSSVGGRRQGRALCVLEHGAPGAARGRTRAPARDFNKRRLLSALRPRAPLLERKHFTGFREEGRGRDIRDGRITDQPPPARPTLGIGPVPGRASSQGLLVPGSVLGP